jgi:hypothetical protein
VLSKEHHYKFSLTVALTFNSHCYTQIFCMVNLQGEIILVEKRWQKFTQNIVPAMVGVLTEGYLLNGYSKYAF